jgi:hypothetical protein
MVRVENHNPYPDCAGLEQSIPQGLEENARFPLVVELICGWEPILWQHISFRMGIKEGTVRLMAERCNVERGSRFADLPNREHSSERVVLRKQRNSVTGIGLDGGLTVNPVTAIARAGAQASTRTTSKRSSDHLTVSELKSWNVRAGGTNEHPSWPIKTVAGADVLQGRYLGPESLCTITAHADHPFRITATFTCLPSDIAVKDLQLRTGKIWQWFSQ